MAALALAGLAASTSSEPPAAQRVSTIRDDRIGEQSDLVASPTHRDLLWLTNDSGDSARVFGVSPRTGRTRAVLTLRTDARDVESLAGGTTSDGRSVLWVGDTGDNSAVRESVVLRLVDEPGSVRSQSTDVVSLRVRYPGGPADVEAMVWTTDHRLLLITKELLGGRVLEVPSSAVDRALAGRSVTRPALAKQVARVSQSFVTDASALPDGRVLVRDYVGVVAYDPPAKGRMRSLASVDLPEQQQGESIAATLDGRYAYAGSEGQVQPLWRVRLPRLPAPERSETPATTRVGQAQRVVRDAVRERPLDWSVVGAVTLLGTVLIAVVAGARRRGRRRR
ncbi:hypothetical protein GCM10028814_25400 [Angustibacter aerolatus]